MPLGIKAHDLDKALGRFAAWPKLNSLHCDAAAGALGELAEFALWYLDQDVPTLCSVQGNEHVWMPAGKRSPDGQPLT